MANDLNRSIKIYLDNSAAMTSADELQKRIGQLESKLIDLQTAGKGNTDQAKKVEKELIAQTQKFEKYKREVADTERVLKNLSGATYNELLKAKKDIDKQLRSTTRNTELYNQRLEVQKTISKELAYVQKELRTEIGCQATSWGRAAGFVNKYMGLIGSALASITGLTMAFNRMREERDKLEESKADVKALTGLDDESIEWLTKQARKLSENVTKDGIRIRQSATEILEAYKLVGSAKPELLANKEALADVTEQTLILASASGMKLTDAVDAVTLALNQYGAGADEAAKYVNVLAAGSKFGAAAVESQTKAIKTSGVAAASANVPIEQLVGTIETLAEKGIKDEIAGTGLKKFFLTLQTGADETNPKVVGLEKALENLSKKQMDATAIKKMFGEEGYNVASVLINETDKVKMYTEAVTGTSVALEQAKIKSETVLAKLAQSRNKINDLGIDLLEKLNPAITGAVDLTVKWTGKLMQVTDWISENMTLIIILTTELALYTAAVKLSAYWEKVNYEEKGKSILLDKAKIIWLKASTAAIHLHWAAMSLLNGHTKDATRSMRAFFATLGLNPITAAAIAVAALTIGLYKFFTRATDAEKAMANLQKRIRSVESEAAQNIAKQKTELEQFLRLARDENESKERRLSAMKKINEISPEYLGSLTLEEINTDKATTAINRYIDSIYKMAKAQAAKEQLVEIEKEKLRLDTNPEAFEEMIPWWEKMEVGLFGLFSKDKADAALAAMVARGRETRDKVKQSLDAESEALRKIIEGNDAAVDELLGNGPKEGDEKTIGGVVYVFKNGEWVKKIKKGSGIKDSEFKAAMDLKLKEMETAHASELALLKKQKLENEQTEQFYNLSVISSDAVYYQKRIDKLQEFLKKAGSKKMQAEINKQIVDVQTKQLEIELKRNKEVISALQDNRDKQLGIIESGYTQQKTILEKAVAEQKITREQADALSLSLETETADKRLVIYQNYQKDILSLESNNGPEKAKAIEDANKAVLDADLKAAQSRVNQQKALQDLLKDFKGQFNLTTVGEETELQLKVLEDVYRAKKEMAIKDGLDTTELDAAYEKAKTNIMQQEEAKRFQIRQQYGFVSLKEQYELERQELQRQYDQGLIDLETFEKAKAQIKVKYLKNSFDYYSGMFSGAITALQDAELANIDAKYDAEIQRAGDNSEEVARLEKEKENKKLAVQKKYAGVQFAIKVSEIIANTAVAVMQAFAQLGPIAGAIAAALMTTTGAAQIAIANAERKKVMSMTVDGSGSGGGSGTRVASGSSSNAGYYVGGWSGDGSPYEVAGPVHRKEYVVPSFVMTEPAAMNHVVALEAMRRQKTNANPLPGSVVGYANGGHSGNTADDRDNQNVGIPVSAVKMLISLLSQLLDRGPIKAYVVQSELQAEQDKLSESRKIGSKS